MSKMDWVYIISTFVRPRLDELSFVALKGAVSGRDPFESMSVVEYATHASLAASRGFGDLLGLLAGKKRLREALRESDYNSYQDLLYTSINGGHLECLRALLDKGWEMCPYRVAVTAVTSGERASAPGRIGILKWLIDSGHDISDYPLCLSAAYTGNLECLKFAHESGCDLLPSSMESAAFCAAGGGHLDCLVYAHESGCSLTIYVANAAAMWGHLDCYEYATRNGCPVDGKTRAVAAHNGWDADYFEIE
jgi:hypothetical protein